MKYKYYIYDFDGTISDSYSVFTKAFLMMLEDFGINDTYESVYSKLKISFGHALKCYDFSNADRKPSDIFKEIRAPLLLTEAKPYSDAEKLLSAVIENGGKNYIYTHSGSIIWEMLEKWDLKKYFAGGVTADMNFPLKPAPDALNYLCQEYKIDKSKAVMIGDRDIDIVAGKNAGIEGILFDPEQFYTGVACEYQVVKLEDVIKI